MFFLPQNNTFVTISLNFDVISIDIKKTPIYRDKHGMTSHADLRDHHREGGFVSELVPKDVSSNLSQLNILHSVISANFDQTRVIASKTVHK